MAQKALGIVSYEPLGDEPQEPTKPKPLGIVSYEPLEPEPPTTSWSAGPSTYAAAQASGQFSPEELEAIWQSPATQQTQTPTYVLPKPQPYVEQPGRVASAKTGGVAINPPIGQGFVPGENVPSGLAQMAHGAVELVAHPRVLPTEPHVLPPSTPEQNSAALNAASDLMEGAAKVATPLAVAGAVIDFPLTAAALGAAYLAGSAAEQAAQYAGADEATQRFYRNLAGTAVATLGARRLYESLSDVAANTAEAVKSTARAGVLRGTLDVAAIRGQAQAQTGAPIETRVSSPFTETTTPPTTGETLGEVISRSPVADIIRNSPEGQAIADMTRHFQPEADVPPTPVENPVTRIIDEGLGTPSPTTAPTPESAIAQPTPAIAQPTPPKPAFQLGVDETGTVPTIRVPPLLPKELSGATPRFNIGPTQYIPQFESDLDKAALILAQKTPSKRDADYLDFVMRNTGTDEAGARALGQQVKEAVKQAVKGQPEGAVPIPNILWNAQPPAAAPGETVSTPETAPIPSQPPATEIPTPVSTPVPTEAVGAETPVAVPIDTRQPWQMTRQDYRGHPDALNVPGSSILASSPSAIEHPAWAAFAAGKYSRKELQALAMVVGSPVSGTKMTVAQNISSMMRGRTAVKDATLDTLNQLTNTQLLDHIENLGGGRPTYLNKYALTAQVINLREGLRRDSKTRLADAKHRLAIETALEAGHTVPPEVLRDYPDLLKAQQPTTEAPVAEEQPAEAPQSTEEPQAALQTETQSTEPHPTRLMGIPVTHVETIKDREGVHAELYSSPTQRAVIRVIDHDSGEVVSLKSYPSLGDAQTIFENMRQSVAGRVRRNAINSNALEDALSPEAQATLSHWFKQRNKSRDLRHTREAMEVYQRLLDMGTPEALAEAKTLRDVVDQFFRNPTHDGAGDVDAAAYSGLQRITGHSDPDPAELMENNVFADAREAGRLIFDTLNPRTADFDTEEFNTAFGMVEFRKPQADVFPVPTDTVRIIVSDAEPPLIAPAAGQTPESWRELAAPILQSWKDEAARIGREEDHSHQVVISLFDRTGEWSKPYADAGYTVKRYDIENGQDLMDFGSWMGDIEELISEGYQIVGVLAAPPCTSFAVSGNATWITHHGTANEAMVKKSYGEWAAKMFDTPVDYANHLVAVVKLVVEQADPKFYAMENPVGRIAKQNQLPKYTLFFDPNAYGDPYTKRTQIWGEFNPHLPTARVGGLKEDGGEGSKIHEQMTGYTKEDQLERSVTPEGFAYAFFMANHDFPLSITGYEPDEGDVDTEDDIQGKVDTDAGTPRPAGPAEPEGTHGPVAVSETGAPQPQRPAGGRPAPSDVSEGAPTDAGRPDTGPRTGTGERGAVSPHARPVGGGREVRPGTVVDEGKEASLAPDLYTITDADAIGTGAPRERIARNFAAIRVLRTLEEEQRRATPDEQKILVKYVGWGGLSRIFEPWKNDPADEDKDSRYWEAQHDALKTLLSREEYQLAANSTQNAHYTSPVVIRAMWQAIERLGVTSGAALEPAAGVGHFVGLSPDNLRKLTWALVEKDGITAGIAKALYPAAYTQHSPFEDATLPADHFTVAVSNVPFGKIPITDPSWDGPPFMRQRIHNYYFGKNLDYVAPGGLVAFITTHGTMDAGDMQKAREYLASRADFLGAIRLPWTAFKKNANTEVVTDIIFLRRRRKGDEANHAAPWLKAETRAFPNKEGALFDQSVNEYFLAHPEMVLGQHSSTGKQRAPNQYNVVPPGKEVAEQMAHWEANGAKQLADAISFLPKKVINIKPPKEALAAFTQAQAPIGSRPFELLIHEGRVAQVIDGRAEPVEVSKADEARIRGLLPIREAQRTLYDLLAADAPDAEVKAAQKTLNTTYDAFVKKFGAISKAENWEPFREDPDLPLLLSLEDYDAETDTAKKESIFTTPTKTEVRRATKADTPQQALTITLGETGQIDVPRIAELLGQNPEDATDALVRDGLIVDTPSGWQLPAIYLSGNVRVKLAEVQAASHMTKGREGYPGEQRYAEAIKLLTSAIPEDIPAHKIRVRLGASWVPADVVQQFVASIAGGARNWTVAYSPQAANWSIEGKASDHTSRFETPDVSTKDLLLDALNDKRRIVKRTEKVEDVKITRVDVKATALARRRKEDIYKAFVSWLFNSDPERRTWAVRTYNDTFNSYVEPHVDGSYLTFPGMAQYWRENIADHQREAIARILQFGNTLLAHVVGAGKTLTMVGAAMEMRRLGIARKPMMVVPNHLIAQVPGEFLKHYPKAKVLVATPDDLSADRRKRFTARVASGDFDAIVMPFSAFVRVSMSAEAETAYQQELLDEIQTLILEEWARLAQEEGGRGGGRSQRKTPPSIKQLENMRDRIQNKLDKIAARPKDDMLSFEQLGVDALFVDEAHGFKNLYFPTRQKASGIPADNDAQRASDMYLKTRYINKTSNYRNVVFATGTPVSNSMAEVFVMQKMLQEQALERANINQFDSWLAQFGQIVVETELDPSGTGMSARPSLKEFRNLPELAAMFRQIADVRMIDDLPELKKKRPALKGGDIEQVTLDHTPLQSQKLAELKQRTDNLDPRDRKTDNMVKITGEGRAAMLDMRLLDRRNPDEPGNKMHRVAQEVADIWKATKKLKGTQLVFLDAGTPGSDQKSSRPRPDRDADGKLVMRPPTEQERHRGFDLYADLKKKLGQKGIPAHEIAFIHDIDKVPKKKQDAARGALFKKVKEGTVRVLIGSTGKMGTGMNVQDRLVALHNVDPAWKPSDIEQRNGRILRQGNLLAKADPDFRIRILNYIAQGSGLQFGFDAYMWQLNERKAKIINDFFNNKLSARDHSLDLEQTVLTAGQMKAVATGNPLTIELGKMQGVLRDLEDIHEGWQDAQREAEFTIEIAREAVAQGEMYQKALRTTARAITPTAEGEELTAVINKKPVTGHTAIAQAILDAAKAATEETKASPAQWSSYKAPVPIGTFRGLAVTLEGRGDDAPHVVFRIPDDVPPRYFGSNNENNDYARVKVNLLVADPQGVGGLAWRKPTPLMTVIQNKINEITINAKHDSASLEKNKAKVATYEQILATPFEQEAELADARKRVEDIKRELGVDTEQDEVQEIEDEGETGKPRTDDEEGGEEETGPEKYHKLIAVQQAVQGLKSAATAIKSTLTTANVTSPKLRSQRYFQYRLGQQAHLLTHAHHALKQYRNMVERMTLDHDQILDIADALQDPVGTGKRVPAELRPWETIRNEIFDHLKQQLKDLGVERDWKDYYLGQVWETEYKPDAPLAQAKRPLGGRGSFLRHKTIPTMREGVEVYKKTPVTWNLVDIDLYKMAEMAKYVLARQTLEDNKALGTFVWGAARAKAPQGMVRIPDVIGAVYAPPELTVREAYDKSLMEGLESFIRQLGVTYTRKATAGKEWGAAGAKSGDIKAKFGGPVDVLMHEVGHTIDALFDLKTKLLQDVPAAATELSALAKLRYKGIPTPPPGYKTYVEEPSELVANLVFGYLYSPETTKQVAPQTYAAFEALIAINPQLQELPNLQAERSFTFSARETTQQLPGPILLGQYYAPPEVARIFKNYLEPGLGAHKAWKLLQVPANALTQAKLAGSAFHGFTVALISAGAEVGRGLGDLARGKPVSAATRIAKGVIEPLDVIRRGYQHKQEYIKTLDTATLAWDAATNLLISGGGRVEQSREYTNRAMAKFMDNLRRANEAYIRQLPKQVATESFKAALRLVPAAVELAAWPVLGWLVPVVKAGAMVSQIEQEIDSLKGVPTQETLLAIATKASDMTDAALGEVIWDNRFMNRAFLNVLQFFIMSPGWRGGSAIILARGITDPIRRLAPSQRETYTVLKTPTAPPPPPGGGPAPPLPKQTPTTLAPTRDVKEQYWSQWTSLAIGITLVQILASELYQLMHGAGHVGSALDVAFPRTGEFTYTGEPERVKLPGYAGIFYDILRNLPRSAMDYILGGGSPLPTAIGDIWHNESFGVAITDPGDPWQQQMRDYYGFMTKQLEPISISSYGRRSGSPVEKAESLAGISPAPRRDVMSDAERLMADYLGPPHLSKEQAERAAEKRSVREAAREGTAAPETAHLSPKEAATARRTAFRIPLVAGMPRLTFTQAAHVYEAATPEERASIRQQLIRKANAELPRTPADQRDDVVRRRDTLLALPFTEAKLPAASGQ